MNKKNASIFLAILLDVLFACLFLLFLSQWQGDSEMTLYMNQVGMYKESINSIACLDKLKGLGLDAYSYQKEDLSIVVTSLSLDEEECKKQQEVLAQNGFSYVLKNVASSGKEFVEAVNSKNYSKVMELMSD